MPGIKVSEVAKGQTGEGRLKTAESDFATDDDDDFLS